MKKINTYLYHTGAQLRFFPGYLLLMLVLVSCEDILVEKPKKVAAENYYNTLAEIETAVNAIYPPFRSNIEEQTVILDTHTDWGYGRGSREDYNAMKGFNSSNTINAGNRWFAFYRAIRNANLVIMNAPKASSVSKPNIDRILAEAKFLRAFAYFQLVRNWASIPLRTDKNMTERDIAKSPVADVYSLIVADLTSAENDLPETQNLVGKPTKYSAKTMLADVYLTLGQYAEARDKANEVIQSNKYSLVPVATKRDFQWNLFGPEIITTAEEIFYFKYSRQSGQGNYIVQIINHISTGAFNLGGSYAHYSFATNPFYVSWNDNDIRKSLWQKADFGLGPNTLVSIKYVEPQGTGVRGAGNDMPIYRYADALLIYAEASCMASNGPTAAGLEALNKVHRRAYGENPNTPSAVDFNISGYTKNTFQDLVLQERAYEFVFEGKRWYDLKRTGKAADIIKAAKGITIAEKAYLWPIPVAELSFNMALDPAKDQNPGY